MASFRRLDNGSYQATIYIGLKEDGTQDRKYATKPTLRECKAAVKEIERALEDKNFSKVMNIRVIALIDDWIETNKTRLSPPTYATYKLYSRAHYAPFFKRMKMKDVEEIHIRKFMSSQLERLSPTTVRKHISVLNKIFREALRDKNPAKYVELPAKAKYTPYPLTDLEFLKVHNAVKGTRDEVIVLLAAWCGLRRGEIFALKPNDIDWKRKTIKIDESTAINDEYDYVDKGPKSHNGYREVVVPSYLMDLLDAYRKSWDGIPERLFNLRPDYYSSYFKEYIIDRHKELPPIRFHDLRHYHASWLYAKGIPDKYAAERLGHDIQTLKAIYQHIGADRREELDNTIRNLYDGQKKGKRWKLKRTCEDRS